MTRAALRQDWIDVVHYLHDALDADLEPMALVRFAERVQLLAAAIRARKGKPVPGLALDCAVQVVPEVLDARGELARVDEVRFVLANLRELDDDDLVVVLS